MPAKLTKAEQISIIPIEEIGKLKGEEGLKLKRKYLRTLRTGYSRRIQQFKRKNVFSYAQESYERSRGTLNVPINKMSSNRLILEIAALQQFFNSETSSLKGINKVNREQDIRIFGSNKRGLPLAKLNDEERKAYWQIYEEYLNEYKTRVPQSGEVQRILGAVSFSEEDSIKPVIGYDEDGKMTVLNKIQIATAIEKRMQEIRSLKNKTKEEYEKEIVKRQNVYSGRGPVIK